MTRKQRLDLASIEYFIHPVLKKVEITDQDRRDFMAWSDRGVKPKSWMKGMIQRFSPGVEALMNGKMFRESSIETYKQDLYDGILWHFEIEDDFPPDVAEYILKATGYYERLKNFRRLQGEDI